MLCAARHETLMPMVSKWAGGVELEITDLYAPPPTLLFTPSSQHHTLLSTLSS